MFFSLCPVSLIHETAITLTKRIEMPQRVSPYGKTKPNVFPNNYQTSLTLNKKQIRAFNLKLSSNESPPSSMPVYENSPNGVERLNKIKKIFRRDPFRVWTNSTDDRSGFNPTRKTAMTPCQCVRLAIVIVCPTYTKRWDCNNIYCHRRDCIDEVDSKMLAVSLSGLETDPPVMIYPVRNKL